MAATDPGALPKVRGNCPLGHGQTLTLLDDGTIACSHDGCERPCAVDEILDDTETEHLAYIGPHSFSLKHPLRERLDEFLLGCDLAACLTSAGGPPVPPGVYRALRTGGVWTFGNRLDTPPAEAPYGLSTPASPQEGEPLIDPDCKAGKCGSCVGAPCEHPCHHATPDQPQEGPS